MHNITRRISITEKENELLNWMIEFYQRCKEFENKYLENTQPLNRKAIKTEYANLKNQIKDKTVEVSKLKLGSDFPNEAFLNLCIFNIYESAAHGFTERIGSTNIKNLVTAVEEGSYRISKSMSDYSNQFD